MREGLSIDRSFPHPPSGHLLPEGEGTACGISNEIGPTIELVKFRARKQRKPEDLPRLCEIILEFGRYDQQGKFGRANSAGRLQAMRIICRAIRPASTITPP